MKWDRRTIGTVAVVFVAIAFASFVIRFAQDHDGETITLGGDAATSTTAADADIETGDVDPESGLRWVLEIELPVEGQATLALIDQGGPFPHDEDGATFFNREGLLPEHDRGYYKEYTVLSPGSTDRGPRRIVAGAGGEYYWTEDHYSSFDRILRRTT